MREIPLWEREMWRDLHRLNDAREDRARPWWARRRTVAVLRVATVAAVLWQIVVLVRAL